MRPERLRNNRPLYPALAAALALGAVAVSCGPLTDLEQELRDSLQPTQHPQTMKQLQPDAGVDAGTVAQPFGGGAPYEDFDGGFGP